MLIPVLKCSLDISANPLDYMPPHLRRGRNLGTRASTKAVLSYLRQMQKHTRWTNIKLMFLGDEGVGKSSLLNAIATALRKSKAAPEASSILQLGRFAQDTNRTMASLATTSDEPAHPPPYQSGLSLSKLLRKGKKKSSVNVSQGDTVGELHEGGEGEGGEGGSSVTVSSDIFVGELEVDRELVFSAWDFPSGEMITNRFYVTDRSMYVICFDATRPVPARIEFWLKMVKAMTTDRPPVLLVGTKAGEW